MLQGSLRLKFLVAPDTSWAGVFRVESPALGALFSLVQVGGLASVLSRIQSHQSASLSVPDFLAPIIPSPVPPPEYESSFLKPFNLHIHALSGTTICQTTHFFLYSCRSLPLSLSSFYASSTLDRRLCRWHLYFLS